MGYFLNLKILEKWFFGYGFCINALKEQLRQHLSGFRCCICGGKAPINPISVVWKVENAE